MPREKTDETAKVAETSTENKVAETTDTAKVTASTDTTKIADETAKIETKEAVAAVEAPKVKMRTVIGIDAHRCYIGGVEYFIEKSKEQSVPEDVATILQRSNKVIIK